MKPEINDIVAFAIGRTEAGEIVHRAACVVGKGPAGTLDLLVNTLPLDYQFGEKLEHRRADLNSKFYAAYQAGESTEQIGKDLWDARHAVWGAIQHNDCFPGSYGATHRTSVTEGDGLYQWSHTACGEYRTAGEPL